MSRSNHNHDRIYQTSKSNIIMTEYIRHLNLIIIMTDYLESAHYNPDEKAAANDEI